MDLAAKDKRCTRFDADFRVELFFLPLLGQSGTGQALDTARAGHSLLRNKLNGGRTGSGLSWPNGIRRASSVGVPAGGPVGGGPVSDAPATPTAREPALHWEREGYRQFVRKLPCAQCAPPPLEDWLLGLADDPAAACPGSVLCRGVVAAAAAATAAAAGTHQGWNGSSNRTASFVDNEASHPPSNSSATGAELPSPHDCRGAMGGGESGIGGTDYVVRADWSLVPWFGGPGLHTPPYDGRFPLAGPPVGSSNGSCEGGEDHHSSPAQRASTSLALEWAEPVSSSGFQTLQFVSWAPL